MTSDDALTADANLTHIAALETQLGDTLTSLASLQERETTLLVELSKARGERTQAQSDAAALRGALRQIRDCEGMYEWLDKRHAAGLGVADLVWVASVAGEALGGKHPGAALVGDAAEWEAIYTAALVDLHRARADVAGLRSVVSEYEPILRERYTPAPIPPCRVCGGPLSLSSFGGGPTVYGCSEYEDDPDRPNHLLRKPGRSVADEHYSQSCHIVYRDGDTRVIAFLDALAADHPGAVSLLTELEAARGVFAAAERYLDLNSECDYVGGEPEVCPGIAAHGHPCHWCQLRAAVAAYVKARQSGG